MKALCLLRRCWNANSGDTGGLVDDTWLNIQWPKIDFLTLTPNRLSASYSVAPWRLGTAALVPSVGHQRAAFHAAAS